MICASVLQQSISIRVEGISADRRAAAYTVPTLAKISLIDSPVTENGRLPTKTCMRDLSALLISLYGLLGTRSPAPPARGRRPSPRPDATLASWSPAREMHRGRSPRYRSTRVCPSPSGDAYSPPPSENSVARSDVGVCKAFPLHAWAGSTAAESMRSPCARRPGAQPGSPARSGARPGPARP